MRERFARYYPRDVWLYLLACGWDRIGQEMPLMQRAGYTGDELGSALIGSRLVRDLMALGFLMERQYAPYPKWFGTAFKSLACAAEMTPLLQQVQSAADWQVRAVALGAGCELAARMHNRLGLTRPMPEHLRPFHSRPFQVIAAEEISAALLEALQYALDLKAKALHVFSDSEVMVRQMNGEYACRSPRLYSLHWVCQKLARSLQFSIAHVSREDNAEANRLANSAVRKRSSPVKAKAVPQQVCSCRANGS